VRLACERHLRDRELAASGHPDGWRFSETHADVAIGFYETVLRLPDVVDEHGDEKAFHLEPAQDFIIGSLLGWLGPDGYRRYREAYLEMGKGNGKTPLLAGLGIFGLVMDNERAAEIYAAAVNRNQARIMFRDAERIRAASPEIAGMVTQTVNNLACGLSFFRPYSRDEGMKSGVRPHMALVDEVHEHPSPEVINKLKAGFKHRKQPLAVLITNSGFDRTSICWQQRQHAEKVLHGVVTDGRFFAYVCALDEGDDPLTDESCWPKANPLLGVTISHEYLRRQVENAKNIPSELNTVLRLNFCVWTQQETRAIDLAQWQACQAPPPDEELAGEPCYGGLDLGQTDDISAFVTVWPLSDGRMVVKARFWLPELALEKYPHRPYGQWRKAGVLEVTEGTTTDYDVIEDAVYDECRRWGVREVAYDKRFAEQMAQHLMGHGIAMVDTPQGFFLNESIRKILKAVTDGELCHGENPVLSWMAGNVVVRHKGEQIRLDKEKAPDKIDGFAALANAVDRIVRHPQETASVYETRGLASI